MANFPPTVVGSTVITFASFNVVEHPVLVLVIVPSVIVEVVGKTKVEVVIDTEPAP